MGLENPRLRGIRVRALLLENVHPDAVSVLTAAGCEVQTAERAYDETVSRARLYRDAGANSIFVPAASEAATIEKLVKAVVLPLNLLAWPGLPDGATLERLGVRRLSAGSGIGKVILNRTLELAKSFLATGRSELFAEGALSNPEINGLMRKN